MELHRSRGSLPLAAICVVGGVFVLASSQGRLLPTVAALGGVVLGVLVLVGALRPFRVVIGPDGLDVRRPGLRGTYRWEQFDTLALVDPPDGSAGSPRLLGVPGTAPPPDLRATAHHPVDGRPAVELLDLAQVRETPDEVAAALIRFAGDRFTDVRTPGGPAAAHLAGARFDGADFDFMVGLRGYRTDQVDGLVRAARDALLRGDAAGRRAARSEIERARAAGLTVAMRGYNTGQVEAALDALCAALADPADDRKTSP